MTFDLLRLILNYPQTVYYEIKVKFNYEWQGFRPMKEYEFNS